MSRIGRTPIVIPSNVTVTIGDDNKVTVKGPKGELSRTLHKDMKVTMEDGQIKIERPSEEKKHKSLHGLTRTLINNMVIGVSTGFKKELSIIGVGYKATLAGNKLTLNLGYSHPIVYQVPEGIKLTVGQDNKILVEGSDKQLVGETAAQIRRFRPPEPYKGKGIRYTDERVIIKVGKSAS